MVIVGRYPLQVDRIRDMNWSLGRIGNGIVNVFCVKKTHMDFTEAMQKFRVIKAFDVHKNILPIIGVEETPSHFLFVSEHFTCTLEDFLNPEKPAVLDHGIFWNDHFPTPALFSLIRDILSGISYINICQKTLVKLSARSIVLVASHGIQALVSPLDIDTFLLPSSHSMMRANLQNVGKLLDLILSRSGYIYYPPLIHSIHDASHFIRMFDSANLKDGIDRFWDRVNMHPMLWDLDTLLEFFVGLRGCLKPPGSFLALFKTKLFKIKDRVIGKQDSAGWEKILKDANACAQIQRRYKVRRITELIKLLRNVKCHPEDKMYERVFGLMRENLEEVRRKYPSLVTELYKMARRDDHVRSCKGFYKRFFG